MNIPREKAFFQVEKSEMRTKLYNTLQRIGLSNPYYWHDYIDILFGKLEFLNDLNRYQGLFKKIFSSNERNEFNSYAFEAAFAYDFEVNGHLLKYEVNNLSNSLTSIDYCYEVEGRKIFFELGVVNETKVLKDFMESKLETQGWYGIIQGGKELRQDAIRLQNLILRKCQDKEGNPIKFGHEEGSYNIIVVYVSNLHFGRIDRSDCLQAMYGDESVPLWRLGVFGLCQQLSVQIIYPLKSSAEEKRRYYEKFRHFRETIHGVLFVKNAFRGGDRKYLVDLELQYFLIMNSDILEKTDGEAINRNLSSFLSAWS